MLQDREGNLWFATYLTGVSRYDGRTFTTFTTKNGLPANSVWSMLQDSAGYIWFGTYGGVSRYDGKRFTTFTANDGLASDAVLSILEDRPGNLWFGTGSGVSRYDGETFTNSTTANGLADNLVQSIFEDSAGYLWFGTGGGVSMYDGQGFTTFTMKDGLADNYVHTIAEDAEGNLWFATGVGFWGTATPGTGGVSRYDGERFTTFTDADGLGNNKVLSILAGSNGNLWFATGAGVSRYDGEGFTTLTTDHGLAHNSVHVIVEDTTGRLWFGSYGGVSQYDPTTFTTFTTADGLAHNSVLCSLEDTSGALWFGTWGGGICKYDGESFTTFTTDDGLAQNSVWSIAQDRDGRLWFATQVGTVSRYDGEIFTHFTTADGFAGSWVYSIMEDRDGHLWFSGGAGVCRYDGQTFTTFNALDGLVSSNARSAAEDRDGNLWFGGVGGVCKYDGDSFTTFTASDGLAQDFVWSILADADNLWFGTNGGVSRYTNQTGFTTVTSDEGLGQDTLRSLYVDNGGHLWFGNLGGVVNRYDGKVFQTLTRHDGMAGGAVYSILQDKRGHFWFGAFNGVTRYVPPEPVPPPVFIDAVVADRRYERETHVTIARSVGLVTFEFHGKSFTTRRGAMVYRYRLVGHEQDWKNTHAEHVEYTDLKRGSYTFEVVAVDRDLVYSERPATVGLKVVAPWYLNGWILFPSVGVILLLLVHSTMATIRYFQSQAKIRQQNAQIAALNEQLQDENLRMGAELQVTEQIQRLILPSKAELEAVGSLDIAGYMEPADEVGGDYYDVLQHAGHLKIAIGDVTGHGVEAGMVMLMTQTAVRTLLESGESDHVRFLDSLNRVVHGNVQRMETDKSLTLCLLDYNDGAIQLSGQHDDPILVRADGQVELVDTMELGFPIGLDDDITDFISQATIQLSPSDGVVLYTDGITEAENEKGEQYGLDRLCEVVSQEWGKSAEGVKDAVVANVKKFIGEQEIYDDITLVVLKQK